VAGVLEAVLAAGGDLLIYTEMTRNVQDREETPLAERPQLRRDDLRRYGEKLTRLADWLGGEGARLGYQPQLGTMIVSEADIDLLMASSDVTVGLVLDTGHLAVAGADPDALARCHAMRITHVYAQDARPELIERSHSEDWSFLHLIREEVLTFPGDTEEGAVDLAALTRSLADIGYEGWLIASAERDSPPADPRNTVETAYAALKNALAAAEAGSHPAQHQAV